MNRIPYTHYKIIDETVDPEKINNIVGILSFFVLGILTFFYWSIWGFGEFTFWFFIKVYLISIPLFLAHELIHVFGYIYFGKAKLSEIKIGIIWKQLMPYAHAKIPMKVVSYRVALILPFVFLGAIPLLLAFLYGNGQWAVISSIMTIGSFGDLYLIWLLRKYSGSEYAMDHPEKIGCIVYKQM